MGKLPAIGPADRRPEPLLRTLLGDVLRRARHGQRRTLADVARAARVSMPYLSELERGRKEASSEVLAAVCDALGVELSDLLAEVGQELAAERARRLLASRVAAERARREEFPVVVPLDAVRARRTVRPAGPAMHPAGPASPHELQDSLAA
ncbi:MAG TPA: helix-turn-helix transcriptional regulator [Streptosporangiaceae bacterium]|jgi:transcriptional regulator with XRE-family HTH domain|nr:helix-turn-helix transcriptional regulator [Streptosporangiaceae bacterium]